MDILRYDTIVVGGGIAGLTSAAYLAKAGDKVLLLEKNREFGGLVNSFQRDGFHFEAGVRALESAGIILPMLDSLGIKLDIVRSRVSVGVEDSILSIEDLSSIQEYRNMLLNLYPDSGEDIDIFIKSMRKIMKHLDVLYGIENPIFKDLKNDIGYILKKLLPWLPKFIFTVGKINRLNRPIEGYLKELIDNPSLRDIISQHFFKGTPTFFALSYFSLYLDYFYPKGGVGKLTDALVDKILELKGEIKSKCSVKDVYVDKQYVVDCNNQRYYYSNLIWAADLKTFYSSTNMDGVDSAIKEKYSVTKEKVMASKGGESIFTLYLEVDLPLSYFRDIAHGHLFYTPSRVGLNDISRGELRSMLDNWSSMDVTEVYSWFNRFLTYNTFEISIPGLKDETLVPPGKTGVIVSFIAEFELFQNLKESGLYREVIEYIENRVVDTLTETIYPKLRDNIIKQFSFTPISIKNRVGSSDGAVVGWSFESEVPVINKIQNSDKSIVTPIPNIFQVGQWAYSPGGVPMSILTGKLAADKICSRR